MFCVGCYDIEANLNQRTMTKMQYKVCGRTAVKKRMLSAQLGARLPEILIFLLCFVFFSTCFVFCQIRYNLSGFVIHPLASATSCPCLLTQNCSVNRTERSVAGCAMMTNTEQK